MHLERPGLPVYPMVGDLFEAVERLLTGLGGEEDLSYGKGLSNLHAAGTQLMRMGV
jgi:hypothetical protein